nr:TRAP transporter small permease subunit [Marinicella sp. W31]MDC2878590.1 TRAP transporter small permease subunit [Marinicella sp. W31]
MRVTALLIARALARTTEILATLIMIVVTALNLTQVGGRYLFNTGFSWTEEYMRYLMIWLMMLGSVACIFRAEHMGIEALEHLAGPAARRWSSPHSIRSPQSSAWYSWSTASRRRSETRARWRQPPAFR